MSVPPLADLGPDDPVPAEFAVPLAQAQQRWTVALRLLLVLPQLVIATLLTLAAEVVVIGGWLAALVLGRLPYPIHRLLSAILGYQARVNAYLYLLTDRYPPFAFWPVPAYSVVLVLPPQQRLNRLAVLFRVALAAPAALAAGWTGTGLLLISPVIWLATLVKGRLPQWAFQAVAIVMRYQLRTLGYFWLLTPCYPFGLFGDRWRRLPPPIATPARQHAQLSTSGAPEADAEVFDYLISTPARNVVVVCLIVGAAAGVGSGILQASLTLPNQAATETVDAYLALAQRLGELSQAQLNCPGAADELGCLRTISGQSAVAVDNFEGQLADIGFPAAASGPVGDLKYEVEQLAATEQSMAGATSVSEYTGLASGVETEATNLDQAYANLMAALGVSMSGAG